MNHATPESRRKQPREQTLPEEIANAVTHGLGLLLSVGCLAVGVVFAALRHAPMRVTAVAVYGATLCLLYLSSTLYHSLPPGRAKHLWNVLDHSSIYLLIAGTYTPITLALAVERPGWGWSLFGTIWGLALLGILFEVAAPKLASYVSLPIYLAMGWVVVMAWSEIRAGLTADGFAMLVIGGLVYTLGVIFYVMDKVPYMHTIWHLFVLGGSVCHWVCITFYVIPWN